MVRKMVVILALATVIGCGSSEPEQPKLTDQQTKEIMDKAKKQSTDERGTRGGGGAAPR